MTINHEREYFYRSERAIHNYNNGRPLIAQVHQKRAEDYAREHYLATGKKIVDPLYTGSSRYISQVSSESFNEGYERGQDEEVETEESGKFWHHIHRAYNSVSVENAQRNSRKALEYAAKHFIKTGKKINARGLLDGLPSGHEHYLDYD